MKSIFQIALIFLIASCQGQISEKKMNYLKSIKIHELDKFYIHESIINFNHKNLIESSNQEELDIKTMLEEVEFNKKYGTLIKANKYFDKSRAQSDSSKSKILLDSSFILNKIAYINEGISCAIGNNITNKLFSGMEKEAIDELLLLESGKFKSTDKNHVYEHWEMEKICFTLSFCYLKNGDFEMADEYQKKLELILNEKGYGLLGQINNLYLKSIIEIMINKDACMTLNKRIEEIEIEILNAYKNKQPIVFFLEGDDFKFHFDRMKSLYNNFCLGNQ